LFALVVGLSRLHIVVTFLALLELAKNQRIMIRQDVRHDDIIIAERSTGEAADTQTEPTEDQHEGKLE
jgi:chromatin segregation and condensation protein Rec8/ScpA/Scc1 (kleisin family)